MEDDVISEAGERQREGFSKAMCGAGDESKRLRSSHVDKYTRTQVLRVPCLPVYLCTCLPPEKIRNEEPNIGRTLREAAHEVWIPVRAERNIHTHWIALFG